MKRKLKAIRSLRLTRLCHGSILIILLFASGTLLAQDGDDKENYEIRIHKVEFKNYPGDPSKVVDTITVKFSIFHAGEGERYLDLSDNDLVKITAKEYIKNKEERIKPEYVEGSLKRTSEKSSYKTVIPDDLYISLLIDRSGSITEEDLMSVKSAIEQFAGEVTSSSRLYYSMFDENISKSKPVTRSLDNSDFTVTDKNILLYNTIFTKLMEFDSTKAIPNEETEKRSGYRRNQELKSAKDGKKSIIVISNGKNQIEDISKIYKSYTTIWEPVLFDAIESYQGKVYLYAMSIGQPPDDPEVFSMICTASGNPKGYYENIEPDPDSILTILQKLGAKMPSQEDMGYDYEIKLKYNYYTTFTGEKRGLSLKIESGDRIFSTPLNHQFLCPGGMSPKTTGEKQLGMILLKGLIAGIIVFLLVMIIIQMLIPLIRNRIFIMKYVKKYKPSDNVRYKECPYCGDPLNHGEKVVIKCQHVVHHLCWKDFDHICPEYGQNCNEGKEEFFDISDPFSKKNKIYYLSWVLFGMVGGFITWIIYVLLSKWPGVFHDLSAWLTGIVRPGISPENLGAFKDKIALFLIIGVFMGLFLTILFSYVEEFRHKTLRIYGKIMIRGLLGSAAGFLSFLIGSIFLVIINRPAAWIYDLLPWVLFGTAIGFIMSVKTTITWKQGVIGGLVSVIFCFLVIYLLISDLLENAMLIGFMFYGASLGISIATIKSRSDHFFLKIIAGKKNQDIIPVHKWMSASGGHNEVYIGRAFACEIQMNWEKNNEDIAGKHAKMYINSRGLPVIISLLKDKIVHFNDRFDLDPGKEYQLYNGAKFKIGQTVFQYIESE